MLQMTQTTPGETHFSALCERWAELRQEQPQLRIRNAAQQLQVSELELLLCRSAETRLALRPEFPALLQAMEAVGEVMVLARNEAVVHEVTGQFKDFTTSSSGAMGLALGQIDVRVFFNQWRYGFRVFEEVRSGLRESLQFFDGAGQAIQKIYRTDNTDGVIWAAMVGRFIDPEPVAPVIAPPRQPALRTAPENIDAESLRDGWLSLRDVHHFNALLKRHSVDRLTALELVGNEHARLLQASATVASDKKTTAPESLMPDLLFHRLSQSHCPVMVFVGNPGLVQIFTGSLNKIVPIKDWLNVLDPGFNLHANTALIHQWWRVRRPSSDGIVTSIEGYDARGELVITLFGARKPGQPENADWRTEIETLEDALCG
tara:strand:- start:1205 stop:2326 length:1122 start_codon:yes stop_codon:yes gene_type:complete